jgi:hypothetical protein
MISHPMKLLTLGLATCMAAVPLRAQNLFIVVENGVRYPVKAVENKSPVIVVGGQARAAKGQSFSLARAPIFGSGVVDVGAFKVEVTTMYSRVGQPQLHVYGRLKADTPLHHCFFVLRVATDAGKSVICDALPDLGPGEDAVYDSLFDLPLHAPPGDGRFETLIFSNGLQLLTSRMAPAFIAAQRSRTAAYLQSHAPH